MSDPTANYHGGAETSVEANSLAEHSRRGRMLAVGAHLAVARDGMTGEELEGATGISHQSMGGVILKLIDVGLAHRPGNKRKTKSGAMALVCYHGQGKNVARTPREAKLHAAMLQRFANALLLGQLTGSGAQAAKDALAKAGFRGRA